jgi:AcrR family transcriptional regulator
VEIAGVLDGPARRRDAKREEAMPRQGLDRTRVFSAALEIVDRDGLERLTMRHLAAELGVEAPSLYKHVRGKDDLLDGVAEVIYGAVQVPPSDDEWPERVAAHARAFRSVLLAHPNAISVVAMRPVASLATLEMMERLLDELVRSGWDLDGAFSVLDTVVSFVVGVALTELSGELARRTTGELDDATAMSFAHQFPLVEATLRRTGHTTTFEFGLQALLVGLRDGFEQRRAALRRSGPGG